jgi:tetratricopeptide (TPR) repeat protein
MSDWGAEDLGVGPRAVKAFTAVLNVEPNNLEAIRSLASTYFSMARPSEARLFCWRAIQLAPRDADMFYLLGVIDWAEAYQPRMKYRYEHNIPLKDSLFDKPGCAGMRKKNLAKVNEGMDMLRRALAAQADFRDAMAYLNLLYRERADIQCGNPVAHSVDMKAAEDWLARWSATKDSSAGPDYRSGYYLPVPPPPPPPPSSDSPSR